jgi:hypothetical protein
MAGFGDLPDFFRRSRGDVVRVVFLAARAASSFQTTAQPPNSRISLATTNAAGATSDAAGSRRYAKTTPPDASATNRLFHP